MLYWAEGTKGKNTAALCNSELPMVRLFKDFLVECLGVGDDRFTVSLNVYLNNGLSIDEIEAYWLDGLDLPRSCLRKHTVDHTPTSSSGRSKRKLRHGVCTLSVLRSTGILHHIFGAVQEYAGFDQPDWLG